MLDELKRQAIEKCAGTVLEDDQIIALPVKPVEIAERLGILVEPKPSSAKGVSGMLVKAGDNFAIAYATHISSEGFRRFSVAHELGHYFIPGHPEAIFANGNQHVSHAGFVAGDPIELEADHFAASLLMPRALFVRAMDRRRDGMDAVQGLAEVCETSLTATAIRYAELSSARVAVVVSSSTTIDYCFMSKSLRTVKGIRWPRKGRPLPKLSATLGLRKRPGAVDSREADSTDGDTTDWFDSDHELSLSEEVIGLGEYGRTLTVLTVDEPDDDDDDAEQSPQFLR